MCSLASATSSVIKAVIITSVSVSVCFCVLIFVFCRFSFTVCRPATKNSYVKIDSRKNVEVKTVTKLICEVSFLSQIYVEFLLIMAVKRWKTTRKLPINSKPTSFQRNDLWPQLRCVIGFIPQYFTLSPYFLTQLPANCRMLSYEQPIGKEKTKAIIVSV